MRQASDQYNFYRVLGVQPGAIEPEILKAHETLAASVRLEDLSGENKKEAALTLVSAQAGRRVLTDKEKRELYDAKLNDAQKAEAEKEKIETKRAGKLQEQQSIEEDEKLKQVSLRVEGAMEALTDFYYEHVFAAAREENIRNVSLEKLLEWIGLERAELLRKSEQKGRRIAFRLDWTGLTNVQEMRRTRNEEIGTIVDRLVNRLAEERKQ